MDRTGARFRLTGAERAARLEQSPAARRLRQTGAVRSDFLATDLYELTMAASYLAHGMSGEATFSCFVRRLPPGRGFVVSCGLEALLARLEGLAPSADDLAELERRGFPEASLQALAALVFEGDVLAAPEGSILAPGEPLLEITAPIAQAQLVETLVLNQLTYQSAVATKAARCRIAAQGRIGLVEFGLRRAHGLEAGMAVSRAAALAGFEATSNVEAAARFDLPVSGTMAHSYVESFPSELEAFLAFGSQFRDRSTFLVDTYDTAAGVGHAVEAIRRLGIGEHASIRIDSGDLAALSLMARRELDAAGLARVRIVVSGNLDEHGLAELAASGAPVDAAGIGTRLAVSDDAPYLECVYKLVAYDGRPVAKQSEGKATLPGAKQVFRRSGLKDVIALRHEAPPGGAWPLLEPVMLHGARIATSRSPGEVLTAARRRFERDLAELPAGARALEDPRPLQAALTPALEALAESVRQAAGRRVEPAAG